MVLVCGTIEGVRKLDVMMDIFFFSTYGMDIQFQY